MIDDIQTTAALPPLDVAKTIERMRELTAMAATCEALAGQPIEIQGYSDVLRVTIKDARAFADRIHAVAVHEFRLIAQEQIAEVRRLAEQLARKDGEA